MNFTLPDLETIINSLLSEGKCACHIINPRKTRILMWREVKNDQEIYHLRIGIQKFTSQEQRDRNGEIYWRYYSYESKESETPTNLSPLTKFQPRPEKVKDYAKSNFEPAVNEQPN